MVKIALLDNDRIVREIQSVNSLDGIIAALKLSNDDYVNLTNREIPITSNITEVVKYNRDTDTFEIVNVCIEPKQPTNAEVAQMISDLQADLIIAGVI